MRTSDKYDALKYLLESCAENNVSLLITPMDYIMYVVDGNPTRSSGYFRPTSENGCPILGIAYGLPVFSFLEVALHEHSHMEQWLSNSPVWNNAMYNIDGLLVEGTDIMFDWQSGKEYDKSLLDSAVITTIDIELDCEKRTVQKLKKYYSDEEIKNYIKKANAYFYSYGAMRLTRKYDSLYKNESIVREMPDYFLPRQEYLHPPGNILQLVNRQGL